MRDPTRPGNFSGAQTQNATNAAAPLRLTATIVSESRRLALINGRYYRVGDRVNGQEITRIEPGSIHLGRAGADIEIRVHAGNRAGIDGVKDQ